MTEPSLSEPPSSSAWPMLALMGTILGVGTIALAVMYPSLSKQATALTPQIVNDQAFNASALTGATKANKAKKAYVPTSAYIEKGADSDITTLDMSKKQGATSTIIQDPDEGIQRTLTRRQNDLIMCYAQGLQADEDLRGRVDFHFRVAADGHVAMVKVTKSTLAHKPTEDCFVTKSKKWTFPKHQGKALTQFDTHFNFVAD